MRYLLQHLIAYWKEHFSFRLYGFTLILTSLLVWFNYALDFEDSRIDRYSDSNIRILWYFLYHILPYYAVVLASAFISGKKDFLRQPGFWLVSSIGFLILAFDRGNNFILPLAKFFSNHSLTFPFTFKMVNRWLPLLTVLVPLGLFYWIYLRKSMGHFFGVRSHGLHLRGYFGLLLLMVPLVLIASYQPDFLKQYPNYQSARGHLMAQHLHWPETLIVVIYEFSYAYSFFMVELFFRGFLIFALSRYLGNEVVLPMAVTYCVLHFGKPMGEAISSFFGGYILGVLALRTKNIYGGIIIHIGIAWLMEVFAFWQLS